MVKLSMVALLLVVPGLSLRKGRPRNGACSIIGCGAPYDPSRACQCDDSCKNSGNCCFDYGDLCEGCATFGCGAAYNKSRPCQCNDLCGRYGSCCSDHGDLCEGDGSPNPSPVPTPPYNPPAPPPAPLNATVYWRDVDMSSMSAIQARMRTETTKLSYGDLWSFYKEGWVNLPGACQEGVLDIYSAKCWTPGSGQCGNYKLEGDCYSREHSWPKKWWNSSKTIEAYSDAFHVMPADGKVNGMRGNDPFGEVNSPRYVSSEGHKSGSCASPGRSGICFEPTDRVKGLLARGTLYMAVRYMNEFICCAMHSVVDGAVLEPVYVDLMLKWSSEHPPAAWEIEFNDRAQRWQGNRNPFIDHPQLAQELFR